MKIKMSTLLVNLA